MTANESFASCTDHEALSLRTTLLLLLFAHIPVSLAVYGGLTEEPVHMIRGTQRQSPVRSADAELATTIVANECKVDVARSQVWT